VGVVKSETGYHLADVDGSKEDEILSQSTVKKESKRPDIVEALSNNISFLV
jgi:hypothetical protein